jgi:Zn-dependent peptidase ImmA (M78 family)
MVGLKATVTPSVLEWARKSAGLVPEDAARKVSARTTAETVLAWEAGEDQPTIPQLRKLAAAYRRPLSLFFLSHPPKTFQPMHDFRRMPGEVANVYTPALMRELRTAEQRRELALELLGDLSEEPPKFQMRQSASDQPEQVGASIRAALGVTIREQTSSRARQNSFGFWRQKVEASGVLVFQAERVDLAEMLGFSIAQNALPVIGVNRKHKRGRVFTILHEFAHLMLHRSGICDIEDDYSRPPEEQRVEVFCNAVAAAALLPAEDLLTEPQVANKGAAKSDFQMEELDALANRYGVSALVVMRRLLTLQRTTEKFYRDKQRAYRAIYARLDKQAQDDLAEGEMARNMPAETVGKLGSPFVRLVLENYYREHITLSDVSDYLGVKVRHVSKIEDKVRSG